MGFQLAELFVTLGTKGENRTFSTLDSIKSSLIGLKAPAQVALTAIGSVVDLAKSGIEAFGVQERAEKRLNAVLKATGHAAGLSSKELRKMASELQNVTNFGDEGTLAAMAKMLTFKSIKGDNFGQAMELAMDLAEAGFGSLEGNAVQLGKALEDPVRGIASLYKSGVSFTEAEQEMIEGLVKAGKLAKAQQVIMAAVAAQVGGTARAMADPWDQLLNTVGDIKEAIGAGLDPIIDTLGQNIRAILPDADTLRETFEAMGQELADSLGEVDFDALARSFTEFGATAKAALEGIIAAGGGVVARIAELMDMLALGKSVGGDVKLGDTVGTAAIEAEIKAMVEERKRLEGMLSSKEATLAELVNQPRSWFKSEIWDRGKRGTLELEIDALKSQIMDLDFGAGIRRKDLETARTVNPQVASGVMGLGGGVLGEVAESLKEGLTANLTTAMQLGKAIGDGFGKSFDKLLPEMKGEFKDLWGRDAFAGFSAQDGLDRLPGLQGDIHSPEWGRDPWADLGTEDRGTTTAFDSFADFAKSLQSGLDDQPVDIAKQQLDEAKGTNAKLEEMPGKIAAAMPKGATFA